MEAEAPRPEDCPDPADAFARLPAVVMRLDADGRVRAINAYGARLLGAAAAAQLLGQVPAVCASRAAGGCETRLKAADGRCLRLAWSVAQDAEGALAVGVEIRAPEPAARRASLDALTQLPDRAHFNEQVALAFEAAGDEAGFALLLVGLDHLRGINSGLGREVGDALIRSASQRIAAALRRDDLLARVGGDEFAILLPREAGTGGEVELAERLLAEIERPHEIDGRELYVTATVGIALRPGHGSDVETLIRNAGAAMAQGKTEERNVYRVYNEALTERTRRRFDLLAELRHAVQRGELLLHYQPQVSLISGEVVGAEALLRWQHPGRGLLQPADFVALAEETNLIDAIDEWVLCALCEQARAWQDAGLAGMRVAANLSARHFRRPTLPARVDAILRDARLDARWLDIELTESATMLDAEAAVAILRRLKDLGVALSLDDFGTGYSSLSYLSRFAVDRLKIDRSFVADVTSNPINASIATATIAMAHTLGKAVVAEGVETEGQLRFLRAHACDEMQGYYFSRPLPAAQFEALLREGRRLDLAGGNDDDGRSTLLLVDDEPHVMSSLRRILRRDGYRILTAAGGPEALEVLANNAVAVIVSDQRMPGMAGTEFLSRVSRLYPDTVRIVLSGYTDLSSVTEAINQGSIYKFFTKPWDDEQLREDIRKAFRHHARTREAG